MMRGKTMFRTADAMPRTARATKLALALTCVCVWGAACWADAPAAYKWVDDQGVVHYGDSVPPQYAQKETTLLNKQGVAIGHKDASKSAAELAAEAAAQEQLARQKQHDSVLLAT